MNVKTMEGLTGASASIQMVATPMSVAKEAESKGDTEKMKRALGYAAGLTDQAEAYSEKTSEGMKADAKEAKRQEKLLQEELIQARKEEREEQEKQIEAGQGQWEDAVYDSVEISEEGRYQAQTDEGSSTAAADTLADGSYNEFGEIAAAAAQTGENLDVSV